MAASLLYPGTVDSNTQQFVQGGTSALRQRGERQDAHSGAVLGY